MSDAPENIWAITEPDDVSADILGDVYAQQVPDGMNGTPIKYIREDVALAMAAAAYEDAIQWCETYPRSHGHRIAEVLRKEIAPNVKAALDQMIHKAVEKERERCADIALNTKLGLTGTLDTVGDVRALIAAAIRRGDGAWCANEYNQRRPDQCGS